MAHNTILLGEGVFTINAVPVAVTRGGSQFMVERTCKEVLADADFGIVKDRVRKDMARPSLVLNALELLPSNLPRMYPATTYSVDTQGLVTTETWEAKRDIESSDYQDEVAFVGRTMDGRGVTIRILNAINLDNIDWTMVDKDEVVPVVTYQGAYEHTDRRTEPWETKWVTNNSAVSAANSLVTANNSPQAAGDYIEVEVTVRDQSSSPIINLAQSDFAFNYGSATGTIQNEYFINDGDGTYRFLITNDTAETVTVTVTADSVQITQTVDIVFS